MTPTSLLTVARLLSEATPTIPIQTGASPTLVIFATLLGGGFLTALVLAYKARAEKGTVVASGSEKAVLSMGRSLEAMEKRALTGEGAESRARSREAALERVLELASTAAGNIAQETDLTQAKAAARLLADQIESALSVHRNQSSV